MSIGHAERRPLSGSRIRRRLIQTVARARELVRQAFTGWRRLLACPHRSPRASHRTKPFVSRGPSVGYLRRRRHGATRRASRRRPPGRCRSATTSPATAGLVHPSGGAVNPDPQDARDLSANCAELRRNATSTHHGARRHLTSADPSGYAAPAGTANNGGACASRPAFLTSAARQPFGRVAPTRLNSQPLNPEPLDGISTPTAGAMGMAVPVRQHAAAAHPRPRRQASRAAHHPADISDRRRELP